MRSGSRSDAGPPPTGPGQKLSALMTSPHALVPRDHQVTRLMLSLMNRELPSDISTLTPPGWLLVAVVSCCASAWLLPGEGRQPARGKLTEVGVTAVLNDEKS